MPAVTTAAPMHIAHQTQAISAAPGPAGASVDSGPRVSQAASKRQQVPAAARLQWAR